MKEVVFEESGLFPIQKGSERDGGEGLRAERLRQLGPACGGQVGHRDGPQLEDHVFVQLPPLGIQGGRRRRGKDRAPPSKQDREEGTLTTI